MPYGENGDAGKIAHDRAGGNTFCAIFSVFCDRACDTTHSVQFPINFSGEGAPALNVVGKLAIGNSKSEMSLARIELATLAEIPALLANRQ